MPSAVRFTRASGTGIVTSTALTTLLNITCKRGTGQVPGAQVINPLLTDIQAALSRGRKELSDGEGLTPVQMQIVHRPGLRPGLLARVMQTDGQWVGLLSSVELRFEVGADRAISATANLEVLRKQA